MNAISESIERKLGRPKLHSHRPLW